MDNSLTIAKEEVCHLIDHSTGVICGMVLDHEDPDIWPFGRCVRHCRKTLEDGTLCENPVMSNGLCYKHGGSAEQALQTYWEGSPTAQARADKLNREQKTIYEMAMADQDVLSHRPDLALIEVRLQELLQELDQWQSEALLKRLQGEVKSASGGIRRELNVLKREARKKTPDIDVIMLQAEEILEISQLKDLSSLLRHGMHTYNTWREIDSLLSRRKMIADSERKRMVDRQKMVTGETAMAVVAQIVEKLREVVLRHCNPKLATLILGEFSAEMRKVVGSD